MSLKAGILMAVLAPAACLFSGGAAAEPNGQAFTGGAPVVTEGEPSATGLNASSLLTGVPGAAAADSPDSSQFAEGTRAVNESRWNDAIRIFAGVADGHGEHADGALYWKAYAEDKLGQSKAAEETCAALRTGYPSSRWMEDCGALVVEIQSKTGKRIELEPWQSDDVKLLAINAMMRQDEGRALAEIQAILNGDSSEKLKKEAQFILGRHYSDTTYAEIVRISYVEGDVRIQRGEPNGKEGNAPWEKAVADLPLETGFSLVTGDGGRAEIEFEDASTLYLDENSVLTFNDLHTTAGVPFSELALLSGAVSLHIHPYVAGERFILRTPTEDLMSRYPEKTYARVESFTDAMSITPLEGGDLHLPGVPREDMGPGRTWTYRQGQLWAEEGEPDTQAFSAWDTWVSDRVAHRDAAIASVMEASGLPAPIPGTAEMAGQGKFFDCAPYGTCWEPNALASEDQTAAEQGRARVETASMRRNRPWLSPSQGGQPHFELADYHPASPLRMAAQAVAPRPTREYDSDFGFPCAPGAVRYRMMKDPVTGRQSVVDTGVVVSQPYDWAVCHAGTWIRHRKHYVWVGGCKRHHVTPVRWVKSDRKVAFVPLHPYDVKGQPPINARHEVFEVIGKGTVVVQPVKFEPNRPIEALKEAPKEFRNEPMRPLAHLDAPRMEAHAFVHMPGNKGTEMAHAGVPIHFDVKSQSFTVARTEMHGGRSTTVLAPMTNHNGSLQARGMSFSSSGGGHGASGSGFHGGSTASFGGASHSGSTSSGSGGASHGGGTSSASSSSSSGSSGGASSGGGSHH